MDPKNANTIIPPSEQRIPDAAGRVSNIRVGDGVIIKIYVEYLDVLGVSDKITNLKQRFVIHWIDGKAFREIREDLMLHWMPKSLIHELIIAI